jgi:primosomal protein N' (replication factor Y)
MAERLQIKDVILSRQDPSKICVAVSVPVRETYFYEVPGELRSQANVGCRVTVPFKNRRVTGYILERAEEVEGKALKPVLDVLDPEPLFHESMVPFFRWMADYYLCPIGLLIQSALPGGINTTTYKTGRITAKGLRALKAYPSKSAEGSYLRWVLENPGQKLPPPLRSADAHQRKGHITIESKARKRRAGPLLKKFIRFKAGTDPEALLNLESNQFRARNEFEFLKRVFDSGGILHQTLAAEFSNGPYLVKKWEKRGILEAYTAPVFRNPAGALFFPSAAPNGLYDQQKSAMAVITKRLVKRKFSTVLLHGVTGSGKTEVYYQTVKRATGMGLQTLLLVPEIALAVYMEGLFRGRLGERVVIYHSGLSDGERYDQWVRMARGDCDLVIGARSALFAPLPQLGAILVDEEHDFAYKQEETPRYQARDDAVVRAKMEDILVVLGSGTPSVQSYHNAVTARYRLLSMPERVERRPLPEVEIVDMKGIPEDSTDEKIISPPLVEALSRNLHVGKQAMLLLNRRGFHRVTLCRQCGQPIRCLNCDLALTHHLEENRLCCHYCGFHAETGQPCRSCGSGRMRTYGFGTEKLEHELNTIFPKARIARMDRDSTRRKGQSFRLLKKFGDGKIDILLGTQMITKGYDFPNVTLVGVLAADFSLGFPDFRSSERTFQILSQVAGRAGRGDEGGRVIIQTFNPEHYAITTARAHDYHLFFEKERHLRQQLGYPPFSYLTLLRIQGNQKEKVVDMARQAGRAMTDILDKWPRRGKEIQVLGPAEAPLGKLKGKYRWHILIKAKSAGLLHYYLREVEKFSTRFLRDSGVRLIMDVDPYQML